MAAFVVLKGFILVAVGAMGPFQPGFGLFWVLGRMGDYNGPCGDYGSFSVLNGPLQAVGEPVGCLQGSVTHCLALPRFLEFILLFSFSGT